MKNHKLTIYLVGVFISLGLYSCDNDDGNYDYHELAEFRIEESEANQTLAVNQLDYVHLTPTLVYDEDLSDIEYTWSIYSSNIDAYNDILADTISKEKNLEYQIVEKPGSYVIEYAATVMSSGRRTTTRYFLNVEGIFGTSGLFVLYDDGYTSDFAIIKTPVFSGTAQEGSVIYDIYSQANPQRPLLGEARKLGFFFNQTSSRVYLLTSEDMVRLSTDNYSVVGDPQDGLFLTPPTTVNPQFYYTRLQPNYPFPWAMYIPIEFMVNDGKIHGLLTDYAGEYPYFMTPKVVTGSSYVASPYISLVGSAINAYDEQNGRFLIGSTYSSELFEFAGTNAEASRNLNRTLLDYEPIQNMNLAAIMKDNDNDAYYLTAVTARNANTAGVVADINISTLTNLSEANLFALHPLAPVGFYATSSTLYNFNYNTYSASANPASVCWTAPDNEEITSLYLMSNAGSDLGGFMENDKNPQGKYMCVSTWNGTEGKIYILELSLATGGFVDLVDSYEGFGKIKDMNFNIGRVVMVLPGQ
ncbi:PKD-like family lipoprotein [Plebeiibacterium sediminum]|uniref:PKD-like family lipoprotein n=1 Tax=Plebeiibacterium sediminum TaxID=2992112 RepID=A0AAE3M3K0_9BACT|nr:PKD-like family lipoprotein [Plebeiobacterium sediminum]MCW3786428.1 PKD-like family lipoprotein [Plebeiobacterium sediminum]